MPAVNKCTVLNITCALVHTYRRLKWNYLFNIHCLSNLRTAQDVSSQKSQQRDKQNRNLKYKLEIIVVQSTIIKFFVVAKNIEIYSTLYVSTERFVKN